jgi:protein TonB
MKKVIFCLFGFVSASSFAQNNNVPLPPTVISTTVTPENCDSCVYDLVAIQEQPGYPGGDTALFGLIKRNTVYPRAAKENGIQGKVFVTFIIDKNGDVIDIALYKGVTVPKEIREKYINDEKYLSNYRAMAKEIDEEALRVVHLMPQWKPGFQNGKAVKVRYILPFNFKLA